MKFWIPTTLVLLLATASTASEASESSDSPSESPDSESPPPGPEYSLDDFDVICESSASYDAEIYTLAEMYPKLSDYGWYLKTFFGRTEYSGGFQKEDPHGTQRQLIKMDYDLMPKPLLSWIQENQKQRLFGQHSDFAWFAPGAIHEQMPFWAGDEDISKECKGVFSSKEALELYSTEPKDGGIIATVEPLIKAEKNKVVFTIEAKKLRLKKTKKNVEKDEL